MVTNFLWDSGSSNDGLLTSVVTLMTTELESIASGDGIVSSVNGSSGLFNQGNTGQGIWSELFYNVGSNSTEPTFTAGANLAGWFLTTPDGSTFESTTEAPPRSPDFIIPLYVGTVAADQVFKADGLVLLPALPFYVFIQNNGGVTTGDGATTAPFLKAAPIAMQY